ncbi:MAG: hypothetical protein IPO40_02795 [Fibrobacteres bacterium]|nr:hypothetical protein [Fibrobacterota bacterium]
MNRIRAMVLPYLLISLNLATALWGLAFPEVYREPATYVNGWSKATLVGVDLVSLAAFVGMAILLVVRRPGPRWNALWLGALFFSAYSHSFQVFTTSLNGKYPFHLTAFVLATWASLSAIQGQIPSSQTSTGSGPKQKIVAAWMITLALVLVGVWTSEWAGQLVAGFGDAHQAAAIQSIAALDLVLAFPAFLLVGIGLWRGGFSDSPLPSALHIAFGIYMAALAVATWTNLSAGNPGALKELPQWAALAVASATSAVAMLPTRIEAHCGTPAVI